MRVLNMTSKPLYIRDALDIHPPANWIIQSGGSMIVKGIHDTLAISIVDTPDGMRICFLTDKGPA